MKIEERDIKVDPPVLVAEGEFPNDIAEQEKILALEESNSANNKRIAKNTVFLYFRMLLTMVIGLYTSRVVIDVLGVEDYGVYNVVGGVIAMFSFLNASMGSATSRFLTYAIGKRNIEETKKVFTTSLVIHVFLALIILTLSESIGLWFLNHKLVIPEHSRYAARVVFQLSIIVALIGILRVPLDAVIIANERFDFYAKIEVLNTILKLVIVFVVAFLDYNKLILYASLILFVTLLIALCYLIYAKKNFKETDISEQIDKGQLKNMLTFSSWDLYGNMTVMARTQGVAMLLNIFFGTVANAAAGVATMVQGVVMNFSSSILAAFKPQIVKHYSQGNYQQMCMLIFNACKFSSILLLIVTIPVLFNIEYLLGLWLKEVPEFAIGFCIWTLLFNLGASLSSGVISGIHATGNIKRPSLINGSLYLLVIPISYILFKMKYPPYYSYFFNTIAVFIGCFSNVYTLGIYIPQFRFKDFTFRVIWPLVLLCSGACIIIVLIQYIFELKEFIFLIISSIISFLVISYSTYLFFLDATLKESVNNKIKLIWRIKSL